MRKMLFFKGKKYVLMGETDRYYICAKTAFRKANPGIVVREEPAEVTEKQERKKAEKKLRKAEAAAKETAVEAEDIDYPNQDTIAEEEGE